MKNIRNEDLREHYPAEKDTHPWIAVDRYGRTLCSPLGNPGLIDFKWDYVDIQQTSTTVETYVFKTGGSGGTTVGTVVVTYTDSSKKDLDTVEKT